MLEFFEGGADDVMRTRPFLRCNSPGCTPTRKWKLGPYVLRNAEGNLGYWPGGMVQARVWC
jgi:hypothetical protein